MTYFDALLTLTLFLWFFLGCGFVVLIGRFLFELWHERRPEKHVELTDQTWRARR